MRKKPQILVDIKKTDNVSVFSGKSLRLDLRNKKSINLPVFKFFKIGALTVVISYLVFGSALAPVDRVQQSLAAQSDAARQQLENQLQSLESQIGQYQDTIDQYRSQGKSLQGEISKLNAQIAKLNLQVKATNLSLSTLNDEIDSNNTKISQTETDIGKNKEILAYMIQDLYSSGSVGMLEVFLKNFALSDFFNDLKNMTDVQDNLRITLENVITLRNDLLDQQTQLALQKDDANSLKAYQISQKQAVDNTKKEKNDLLVSTKGQESRYRDLLNQTQQTAAQIRSQIFKLLGGGELSFGDAVKIAQLAEKATGVRAAFILAILTQESSVNTVIGANLGKCYYNDPRNNPSGTVMGDSQKTAFLNIMSELGLDPARTQVSCPITSDGTYGGAMGPAQFMPNTWLIYSDSVSGITGNRPASPFNNADAFTGTALYLQGSLTGCKTIYKTIFSQENCAAAKYYAGAYWKSYMSVGRYGYRVADRASNFADEIAILNSNN